jgi:hypothetical protein
MRDASAAPQGTGSATPQGSEQAVSKGKQAKGRPSQKCKKCFKSGHLEAQCQARLCPSCRGFHNGSCHRQLPKGELDQRANRYMDAAASAKTEAEAALWRGRLEALVEAQALPAQSEPAKRDRKRKARSPSPSGGSEPRQGGDHPSEKRRDSRRR